MKRSIFETERRICISYHQDHPGFLLIQPADEHDINVLDHQAELIRTEPKEPFLLVAFRVTDRIQHELLKAQTVSCELEWNEGNHFKEPDVRTANGFISCIKTALSGSRFFPIH